MTEADEHTQELAREYSTVADGVLKSIKNADTQQRINNILRDPETFRVYVDMRDNNVPVGEAADVLRYGCEKGFKLGAAEVYKIIGARVRRAGRHVRAVEALERDGYLTPSESEGVQERIETRTRSHLEGKVAAAWLMICLGIVLIIFSANGITGAVVGFSGTTAPFSFIAGFVLFVIGLFLKRN